MTHSATLGHLHMPARNAQLAATSALTTNAQHMMQTAKNSMSFLKNVSNAQQSMRQWKINA
jgi:hypothetical protein